MSLDFTQDDHCPFGNIYKDRGMVRFGANTSDKSISLYIRKSDVKRNAFNMALSIESHIMFIMIANVIYIYIRGNAKLEIFDNLSKVQKEVPTSDVTLKNIDGISLLGKNKNGLIDDKSFLGFFGKIKVFYSSPFGDYKGVDKRLFVMPAQDNNAYIRVFSSTERAIEFYEQAGRRSYLIMEVLLILY